MSPTTIKALGFRQTMPNTRAQEMWQHIIKVVEFRNKTVLDAGCGYGDFVWRSHVAGAKMVLAMDMCQKFEVNNERIVFLQEDVLKLPQMGVEPDLVICFSVLPYLYSEYNRLLDWMAQRPESLLEFQYKPEPFNIGIRNDKEALDMLLSKWRSVTNLGKSRVVSRDTFRTIWHLKQE
jgi:hypothetical protein